MVASSGRVGAGVEVWVQSLLLPQKDLQQVRKIAVLYHVGSEVGPTAAFYSCVLTGRHGPACIFWANLTFFSLQFFVSCRNEVKAVVVGLHSVAQRLADAPQSAPIFELKPAHRSPTGWLAAIGALQQMQPTSPPHALTRQLVQCKAAIEEVFLSEQGRPAAGLVRFQSNRLRL